MEIELAFIAVQRPCFATYKAANPFTLLKSFEICPHQAV